MNKSFKFNPTDPNHILGLLTAMSGLTFVSACLYKAFTLVQASALHLF